MDICNDVRDILLAWGHEYSKLLGKKTPYFKK